MKTESYCQVYANHKECRWFMDDDKNCSGCSDRVAVAISDDC